GTYDGKLRPRASLAVVTDSRRQLRYYPRSDHVWRVSPFFFFYGYGPHRDLHSFPTRRSSDLWHGRTLRGAIRLAILRGQVIAREDRKSTRLNSSHLGISYAVFCLKKKRKMPRTARSIVTCIAESIPP